MSSKPEMFTENEAVGYAVVSGKRGMTQRVASKLAGLGAVVLLASAIMPGAVHAQSWYSSPNTSARVYDTQSSLQSQNVETGTIIGVRPVMLRQNTSTNGGTVIGGIVGAALGAEVSRNTHNYAARTLATAISGIGGAAIGTRISNGSSARPAIQVFVRNDRTRQTVAVVEDNDQPGMVVGAEVAMVRSRNGYAITPINLPRDQPQVGYGQPQRLQSTTYVREGGYPAVQPVSNEGSVNPTVIQNIVRSRSYP